jgi:hypothetical protein
VVGAEGVDQPIDIKLDGVGAFIADGQEGVALPDVGAAIHSKSFFSLRRTVWFLLNTHRKKSSS